MLDREAEGLMRTVVEFGPRALRRPRDLNARANLMWAATWAINGYLDGGKTQAWSCHAMEHELSAFYDVTHGAGLAVLTPAWMEFCLKLAEQWDKSDDVSLEHEALVVLDKLYAFGVNVWGIDPSLPKAKVASKAIKATRTAEMAAASARPRRK
jgi:alcohol dehydrogenase YqhD (iron-dependent ADH family)